MGPTDEELMSAYVAGSARAFEGLFARLAPRVHGFFLRSFRNEAVADDLLQVTFMKVHRARAQYRPELKLMPWIFAVAARVRLDELRRRLRLPEDADEEAVGALGSAGLPPPSSRALQRASAPILAQLAPSRWRLRAAAVLVAFAVPMLFSRNRDWEGWAAALLALVLATVLSATAGVVRAGAWVALAASAGFAIAAGGIPGFSGSGEELAARIGLDCFGLEMLGAAVAAGAVLWREGRDARALPAVAAAGALAAQAALHLTCGAHDQATHLWVFHVGAIAAAALAGWALQSRLYASRARI